MNDVDRQEPDRSAARQIAYRSLERAQYPERFDFALAVGQRVQTVREQLTMSRGDLALRSGIGDLKIHLLEQGLLYLWEVEDEEIEILAEALGHAYYDLVPDEETQPEKTSEPRLVPAATKHGKEIVSRVLGYVRQRFSGGWMWQAVPVSTLTPASPASGEKEVEPTARLDQATNQLFIEAGPRYAGGEALLLDSERRAIVSQVALDAEGRGRLAIPGEGTGFQVELIEPNTE